MTPEPLTDAELDFLGEMLMKYGNDDSILDVSGLDGFLTAIVSGPETVMPSRWMPALWGGEAHSPEWETMEECQRFLELLFRLMNDIAVMLCHCPEDFEALFNMRAAHPEIVIVEEWCFGYMRGVALADWSALPEDMHTWLDAIALHGLEENFDILRNLSIEEHQQTAAEVEPAARKLHAYWLSQRSGAVQPLMAPTPIHSTSPVRLASKTGRNDPCPCGSGKKFKQCCLH